MKTKLGNKGQMEMLQLGAVIGVVLFIALLAAGYFGVFGTTVITPGGGGGGVTPAPTANPCGDDGVGVISLRLKNTENTSQAEWYAAAFYVYEVNGNTEKFRETVTTGATATYVSSGNLECGKTYKLYMLSADGARGDNNFVEGLTGNSNFQVVDGVIVVTMNAEVVPITVHGSAHATMEFRVRDNNEDGWMYDSADADATDWELTGVKFTSTTNNRTNMTVGNDGDFDVTIYARAIQKNTKFQADGPGSVIVTINADSGAWDEDYLSFDCGSTTELQTSQLTPEENDKWSSHEKFYKVDKAITNTPGISCRATGVAKSSVSTWYCPVYTFATRGNYVGTLSGDIETHSAAKDDSSNTAVYTVQTVTLWTQAVGGTGGSGKPCTVSS